MHWQQYTTLGLAIFGGSISFVKALASPVTEKRVEAAISVLVVLGFQYVLYSGGWYGN